VPAFYWIVSSTLTLAGFNSSVLENSLRASKVSKTLSGVYKFEICGMYVCVYMDIREA